MVESHLCMIKLSRCTCLILLTLFIHMHSILIHRNMCKESLCTVYLVRPLLDWEALQVNTLALVTVQMDY